VAEVPASFSGKLVASSVRTREKRGFFFTEKLDHFITGTSHILYICLGCAHDSCDCRVLPRCVWQVPTHGDGPGGQVEVPHVEEGSARRGELHHHQEEPRGKHRLPV